MSSIKRNSGNSNGNNVLAAFLSVILFSIYYRSSYNNITSWELSDLKEHSEFARGISANNFFESWVKIPYLMWHLTVKLFLTATSIPYEHAVAFSCAIYFFLTFWLIYYMLKKIVIYYTNGAHDKLCAIASATLMLIQPLYVSWFNQDQYLGQFSINPLFNPTHMAVKWIGLISTMAGIDIFYSCFDKRMIFFAEYSKNIYYIFSASLLVSTMFKPTYAFMLLPAGFVFLFVALIDALVKKSSHLEEIWKTCWKTAISCLPALIYIGIEYLAFFLFAEEAERSGVIISAPFEAWSHYTPNIVKSIILSMIAPAWVVITNYKYFIKSIEGKFSILCYFVGALEFAFIAEGGERLLHLNFAWEYMSGMLVVFVIAMAKLVVETINNREGKGSNIVLTAGWVLFFLQLYAGFYYFNPFVYIL